MIDGISAGEVRVQADRAAGGLGGGGYECQASFPSGGGGRKRKGGGREEGGRTR